MASYSPIKDKNGNITGYRIRIYRGRDSDGKKLKDYSMNWKIPESYKSERAIQKELERIAGEFETKCKRGEVSSDGRTFIDYINYYLELKESEFKDSTISFYQRLMPVIEEEFAGIRLKKLTTEHLNKFYLKLQKGDVRRNKKARAKDCLIEKRQKDGTLSKVLQAETQLSDNTIRICFKQQNIAIESAEKIANYYKMPFDKAFEIISDGKGYAPKYINHFHSFIHVVLEEAVKEGCIAKNIADLASPPKAKKKEAEYFEIEEILLIKEALKDEPLKYRVATYLLIDLGIRRGELIGIKWSAIDFENCTIKIDNNVVYVEKKGLNAYTPKNDEFRTLSFAKELVPILKEYKREQNAFARAKFSHITNEVEKRKAIRNFNSEGYLFIQDSGKVMTPNAINKWMINLSDKVGFRIYPHKFRHSQASILYQVGVDIVTVSKRLGHKQVSTTQNIYAHLLNKSDKNASDKIANVLFGTGTDD